MKDIRLTIAVAWVVLTVAGCDNGPVVQTETVMLADRELYFHSEDKIDQLFQIEDELYWIALPVGVSDWLANGDRIRFQYRYIIDLRDIYGWPQRAYWAEQVEVLDEGDQHDPLR